jgi:hypothetical protein
MSPPSSWSKNKPSRNAAKKEVTSVKVGGIRATFFHVGLLLGVFFAHEDGGDVPLRKAG